VIHINFNFTAERVILSRSAGRQGKGAKAGKNQTKKPALNSVFN
jgi:hypothetical protein